MDAKCGLGVLILLASYLVYTIALFSPRLGDYVAKATLAALIGLLVYMVTRYWLARCRRLSGGEELLKTPIG